MEAYRTLIDVLAKLPGIGRRSAERMAMRLVLERDTLLPELVGALERARSAVASCERCGALTGADRNPCRCCTSTTRDGRTVCVVEEPDDVIHLERSGGFQGRYHVLMGKFSPAKGQSPASLRIRSLLERVRDEKFEEVLLALSTDMEGDATAAFIVEALKGTGVRVTRLAWGLPADSGIGYSDAVTLARAIRGRVREL